MTVNFHTIILPVRPQPDTIVAIFILKRYGEEKFPGIKTSKVDFWPTVPSGKTPDQLLNEGYILIDLGGGPFDHHNKVPKMTASELVSGELGVEEDPSLSKLLAYARRDDVSGKGTMSADPIDRAFGLSALITALNKSLPQSPAKVVETVLPLIVAHHNEERRRTEEFPRELEQKKTENKVIEFAVRQRDKNLRVIMIESDNVGLPGFLRSQLGGRNDVVVQRLSSGHVNVLTRPTKRVDLRALVALTRLREADMQHISLAKDDIRQYMTPGRIDAIKEWYYDTATNSLLNGGLIRSDDLKPTQINWQELKKIIELGLAEAIINPREI